MTRDAKIGMLTGLGVIVLIGVLLSEYLGGPSSATPAAQNRMASLPIGASYRDKVMQPVIAPGTVHTIAGDTAPTADPLTPDVNTLPTAFASINNDGQPAQPDGSLPGPTPAGPEIRNPVTPVPAGNVLAIGNTDPGQTPIIQVGGTQPISLQTSRTPVAAAIKPAVTLQEYVILPGDTLSKIAKKFYQSSKNDNVQKIITANPTTLKSVTTMLVAGKKLMIPVAAQPLAATPKPAAPKVDPRTSVLVRAPGSTGTPLITSGGPQPLNPGGSVAKADAPKPDAPKADPAKKAAATVYVVVAGDTLDKIAKKISPAKYLDLAKQIASLNKIKDPHSLQVGMTLKLPVKP